MKRGLLPAWNQLGLVFASTFAVSVKDSSRSCRRGKNDGYNKFNGADSNYDGFGRNASANNTLYALVWLMF